MQHADQDTLNAAEAMAVDHDREIVALTNQRRVASGKPPLTRRAEGGDHGSQSCRACVQRRAGYELAPRAHQRHRTIALIIPEPAALSPLATIHWRLSEPAPEVAAIAFRHGRTRSPGDSATALYRSLLRGQEALRTIRDDQKTEL
jgi:hypothetical protein